MPDPPENVRIIRADGAVVPLELVYAGTRADGAHVWRTVTDVRGEPGDELAADRLPPHTVLDIGLTRS
jgi:hypothetical protein